MFTMETKNAGMPFVELSYISWNRRLRVELPSSYVTKRK